jgi:hypothetical protein
MTPAEDIAFLRSLVPNIHINETALKYADAINRLEKRLANAGHGASVKAFHAHQQARPM